MEDLHALAEDHETLIDRRGLLEPVAWVRRRRFQRTSLKGGEGRRGLRTGAARVLRPLGPSEVDD